MWTAVQLFALRYSLSIIFRLRNILDFIIKIELKNELNIDSAPPNLSNMNQLLLRPVLMRSTNSAAVLLPPVLVRSMNSADDLPLPPLAVLVRSTNSDCLPLSPISSPVSRTYETNETNLQTAYDHLSEQEYAEYIQDRRMSL